MKTPANHPWKSKQTHTKVRAECVACGKEYQRDPESRAKTCSDPCFKQYARVKSMMHLTKGGFR